LQTPQKPKPNSKPILIFIQSTNPHQRKKQNKNKSNFSIKLSKGKVRPRKEEVKAGPRNLTKS
jgi:hypothetical protein